jgi:hypothetical protein
MSELGSVSYPQTRSVRFNRRAEERLSESITAAIVGSYRMEVIPATVIDHSERGIKLSVDQNWFLPKVIVLVDFRSNSVLKCKVRWRRGCYTGVQIVDEYSPARRRRFFETHQLRNCRGFDPAPER